jgi:hypothetical protein
MHNPGLTNAPAGNVKGSDGLKECVLQLLGSAESFGRTYGIVDIGVAHEQRDALANKIGQHLRLRGDVTVFQLLQLIARAKRIDRLTGMVVAGMNSFLAFGPFGAAASSGSIVGSVLGTLVGGPLGTIVGTVAGGALGALLGALYASPMATTLAKVAADFRKKRPEYTTRQTVRKSKHVVAYYAGFSGPSMALPLGQAITVGLVPASTLATGIAFGAAGIALAPLTSGLGALLTVAITEAMCSRTAGAMLGISKDNDGKIQFEPKLIDKNLTQLKMRSTGRGLVSNLYNYSSALQKDFGRAWRQSLRDPQTKRNWRALVTGALAGVVAGIAAPEIGIASGPAASIGRTAGLLGPWAAARIPVPPPAERKPVTTEKQLSR